jgi:hypothetical protein
MNETLDALILSFASERWQKVARIIGQVSERTGDETKLDAIAIRIRALVDDGELEAKGDLSRWRYSEVRHPQSTSAESSVQDGSAKRGRHGDRLRDEAI